MFSAESRQRAHDAILAMATDDPRIVGAAAVGGWATEPHDRWSDIDLTFAVDGSIEDVLTDWTHRIRGDLGASFLFDLPYRSAIFRVFLFPGALQVDLSFWPPADFGPYTPRFRLLFGEARDQEPLPSLDAGHFFGLAAHHAVRARLSIERGRLWQAEHWLRGLREETFKIAAIRHGVEPRELRGADELPSDVLANFGPTLARSLEPGELLRALGAGIDALLAVGDDRDGIGDQLRTLAG